MLMATYANHGSSESGRWPHISPVRVLIADDHPVVRIGVRNMLSAEPIIEVVGEAGDGNEALEQTKRLSPHVMLLDLSMPRMSGFEVMQRIMADLPTVKIILLTAAITPQKLIEALQTGVRGIILKNTLTDCMTKAVMSVASGDYWIAEKRVVNLVAALHDLEIEAARPQHRSYGLTPREMEVVGCIIEGCSNRDIAQQFSISEETIKRHLSNIFDKTGVSTRLELAIFAIAHELAHPSS